MANSAILRPNTQARCLAVFSGNVNLALVISSKAIVAAGLDSASLKPLFDPPSGVVSDPIRKMIDRWRSRSQSGRDMNLSHYRLYAAIDRAWDIGFQQASQTLVGLIKDLSENSQDDDRAALSAANSWGMTHLITAEINPKTGKPTGKKLLNLPVMFGVNIALARATTMMRVAKIVNERLAVPLMKFEPAFTSEQDMLFTEIATQRIETGNREFGYSALFSEAVEAAAIYGQQLQLITEEWYSEMDYPGEDLTPRVGKEGLRYSLPHPSRSYYDIDWPQWTFNHDCGTRYVGYWRITTFGNVRNQSSWWNLNRIVRTGRFTDSKWVAYFQNTGQCRMSAGSNNDWFSRLDREQRIDSGSNFFSAAEDDQPIWITEHFEKFNPRTEFENPNMPDADIWFRIVLASDDTPLYVTALCDRPGAFWLYEPMGSRAIQQGLMLELMPFQDHASNIMTQSLLSSKQDLANVTLFDKDVVEPQDVKRDLENPGEKFYRKLNFWSFSGRKLLRQQSSIDSVFKSYRFPSQNVSQHLQLLGQLIELMNRVVGMSDQEVGSTASHEQSAEEIRAIHTATSHRFEFIASWFDTVFESWKRQLYTYYTQYSSMPAYAFLGSEYFERVKKAGFEIAQDANGIHVKAPMSRLRVEHFIAQRDGPNRIPWTTIGGQMLTFLQTFMASPVAATMAPDATIKLVNSALEALQFPRSFRIPPPGVDGQIPPMIQTYVQHQLQGLAEKVKEFVAAQSGEVAKELKAEIETVASNMNQVAKAYTDLRIGADGASIQ